MSEGFTSEQRRLIWGFVRRGSVLVLLPWTAACVAVASALMWWLAAETFLPRFLLLSIVFIPWFSVSSIVVVALVQVLTERLDRMERNRSPAEPPEPK